MSKIFGAVQSIGQLLGNRDILNGVEFSTVRDKIKDYWESLKIFGK